MNLAYLLQRAAKTWGGRPALSVGRTVRLSYAEMGARVPRLAAGLIAAGGLQRGDRVELVLKNGPEYWELMFALWHAGLAAVPVNAKRHARAVAWIVENSGAKLVGLGTAWGREREGTD